MTATQTPWGVHLSPSLVWFRLDLRLADNPALAAAFARGGPVVPCYILDEKECGDWGVGGASKWWLHHSLTALARSLEAKSLQLIVRRGDSSEEIASLIKETGAGAVYWNRRYEPAVIARDAAIKEDLRRDGTDVKSFNASLLNEPHAIRNKQGGPFQVFTPFWKHCLTLPVEKPVELPKFTPPPLGKSVRSLTVPELSLLPKLDWADGFSARWTPGEAGASAQVKRFLTSRVERYADQRDVPEAQAVSELSPFLHFGETSPRLLWAKAAELSRDTGVFPSSRGLQKFLSEVGWREFGYHLLYHFPHTPTEALREEFRAFPWAEDPDGRLFRKWTKGQTGYPLIDAGMRELWATGWMHNRVRMVVASFLVKHLRLPWQQGARWFWDTLVDADLASNTLGWQWSAGCGADAAPYFRVFNPVLQGENFDSDGAYVRRWVPELKDVPAQWIHRPWEAPEEVLLRAGVFLGREYPKPLVDHGVAREQALAAHASLRKAAGPGR